MKAKRKELKKLTITASSKVAIVEQTIQERTRLNKVLDGKDPVAAAHELVRLLHEEAKVI